MNWFENMNNALAYIERNLTEKITTEEVAAHAYASKYHFIRIFYMLTGMTLNEYVRGRRLSLAAMELQSSDQKVIDLALRYGYETPEAFSKAFKKLHGVSPTEARKGGATLQAIPPISFQVTVRGEARMDYKIIKREAFRVVGPARRVRTEGGENFRAIPEFWQEIIQDGRYAQLERIAGQLGILGICYGSDEAQESFSYMIGVEGDTIEAVAEVESIEIPASTFAVFTSVGPLPDALQNVWKRIFTEWFPATGYEHAPSPELEVYYPGDPSASDYKSEVWIPIIEK